MNSIEVWTREMYLGPELGFQAVIYTVQFRMGRGGLWCCLFDYGPDTDGLEKLGLRCGKFQRNIYSTPDVMRERWKDEPGRAFLGML